MPSRMQQFGVAVKRCQLLGMLLIQDACNVGDEGGFAPNIGSNEEGLNLVNQAIEVQKLLLLFL